MAYVRGVAQRGTVSVVGAVAAMLIIGSADACAPDSAVGPYGGDVVPLEGEIKAEILANAETGEILTRTWNGDLSEPAPIGAEPLEIGSGEDRVVLEPYPTESDPAGYCSRFYGRAEWISRGSIENGWIRQMHGNTARRQFAWRHSFAGGREHGSMWSEMGPHRGHGGHGPGTDSSPRH